MTDPTYRTRRQQEKWDRFYLGLAEYYSTASKDPSTKVGAILVNSRNRVKGLGYNGFPEGVQDTPERLNNRELKYEMVVHAEINALFEAGPAETRGGTLYVFPSFQLPPICANCAKFAIQSGIAAIVGFNPDPEDERVKRWASSIAIARTMFQEAGIPWRSYDEI